jgi:hypothetical protein
LHADDIGQPQGRDARAERAVNPMTGVGQQDPGRDASRKSGLDLIERDPWLGLEDHLVWNMNFLRRAASFAQSSGKYSR